MRIHKGTKWLCEHARALEQYSGKWVMFSVKEGLVSQGAALDRVLHAARKKKAARAPYIFHIPSCDELQSPLPALKKT